MDYKFKTGDRVRLTKKLTDTDPPIGTEGCLGDPTVWSSEPAWNISNTTKPNSTVWAESQIELVVRASVPARPTKFILSFDDRHEGFTSEKGLRCRIAELAKEPVAGRTYTVYDIKRVRTVSSGVKITLK